MDSWIWIYELNKLVFIVFTFWCLDPVNTRDFLRGFRNQDYHPLHAGVVGPVTGKLRSGKQVEMDGGFGNESG